MIEENVNKKIQKDVKETKTIKTKKNTNSKTEDEELIDILMATYNSNIYFLKIQIDSILNQSYKNIRLIISDDASKDEKVKETLKQYKEKDKRIQVYFQEKNCTSHLP